MKSVLKFVIFLLVLFKGALARPSDSDNGEKRLIQTSETEIPKWLTQDQIDTLQTSNINFMDITDHREPPSLTTYETRLPTTLRFPQIVNPVLKLISIPRMQTFLTTFSMYHTRYYTTATGIESANWLYEQVLGIVADYPTHQRNVSVSTHKHTWAQPSIIARIEGSDLTLKSEVIILGAHLDSVNGGNPSGGRSPGADDNGSGTVVILESFRTLLASGFRPKRTVEVHWYAAEEVGLRGSQDIAAAYKNEKVNVISMINFDVVSYYTSKQIGITTDYTDAAVNAFLRVVVDGYCNWTWKNIPCGYACSDHGSWNRQGYPAGFPLEPIDHPQMHRVGDSYDTVNFEQAVEFIKLAVGYVIEISEPY